MVRERLGTRFGVSVDCVVVGHDDTGAPVVGLRSGAYGRQDLDSASEISASMSLTFSSPSPPSGGGERVSQKLERRSAGHISVSHTRGWVAVVWHPTERCGVDIELRGRALPAAAASRYGLSSMEDWCAREACFKYAGAMGVDLADIDPAVVRFIDHPELIVAVIGDFL